MHPDLAYLILRGARAYTFASNDAWPSRAIRIITPRCKEILVGSSTQWVIGINEYVLEGQHPEEPIWLEWDQVPYAELFTKFRGVYEAFIADSNTQIT